MPATTPCHVHKPRDRTPVATLGARSENAIFTPRSPPSAAGCIHVPEKVRGFSVAELLSAIVVLAVGILGVAALYADRIHEQTHSPRSIATALAEEMSDRIHSRGDARTATTRLQVAPFCTQLPGPADNPSSAETLARDAACWQEKVARALPNGTGMVEREDSLAGYRITVSWSEAGIGAASLVMHAN